MSPARLALSAFGLALAFAPAPGCAQATCSDYHAPGCWTPPPDAGGDAGLDGSADDASLDGGADDAGLDGSADDATASGD